MTFLSRGSNKLKWLAVVLVCPIVSATLGYFGFVLFFGSPLEDPSLRIYSRLSDDTQKTQEEVQNLIEISQQEEATYLHHISGNKENLQNQAKTIQKQISHLQGLENQVHTRLKKLQAIQSIYSGNQKTDVATSTPTSNHAKADKSFTDLQSVAAEVNKQFSKPVIKLEKTADGYVSSIDGLALLASGTKETKISQVNSHHLLKFWQETTRQSPTKSIKVLAGAKVPFNEIATVVNYLKNQFHENLHYEPTDDSAMTEQLQIQVKMHPSN